MTHTQRPRSKTNLSPRLSLSTRQLFDLELGLFLLRSVSPEAPPTALPALLTPTGTPDRPNPAGLTPRQHKYLSRARLLLAHVAHPDHWQALLHAYAVAPADSAAFDLSHDCRYFAEKTVGFSRNRLSVLRKMLA